MQHRHRDEAAWRGSLYPSLVLVLDPAERAGAFECSASRQSCYRFAPDEVVELRDDPARVAGSEELVAALRRELATRPEVDELQSGRVALAGDGDGWELAYARRDRPGQVARCAHGVS